MEAVRCNRWAVLFELALRTGLRRGELPGLRWSDIDLHAGTLTVVRTLQYTPEGMRALPKKTAGSQRRLILPAACVQSLTEHRRRQYLERRAAGPQWRNYDGFVFVTAEGRTVDPGSINRNLHAACDMAGIRRIRFHDLRHSCATLLLEQGVQLVTIKDLLGHAQIHTTANIYSHVRLPLQLDALEAMGRALGEPPNARPDGGDTGDDPEPEHPDHDAQ